MQPALEVRGLSARYDTLPAVEAVNLTVAPGEIVGLIGPNGSGKTTVLRAIAGITPSIGEIFLHGQPVHKLPPHRRVHLGLVLAPDRARVAEELSVMENILVGAYRRRRDAQIPADLNRIFYWAPSLQSRMHLPSGMLSGGERQMVVLARALLARPRVLLLDEPLLGLDEKARQTVLQVIAGLTQDGVAVFLAEHDFDALRGVAGRVYAMRAGKILFAGTLPDLESSGLIEELFSD